MTQAQIRRIGIMSPGDMGQAVAQRLKELGFEVSTALEGRSERTRTLAREAGIGDSGSLAALLASTDLVLSIVDPGSAMALAKEAAAIMPALATRPLFADCNALAPQTKREMHALLTEAGGRFLDAGIIGPPPRGTGKIHFYVAGPGAGELGVLEHETISVRIVSERIGDAAAVKMCYGGITKGTVALLTELLVAARRLGVEDVLDKELRESQSVIRDWILRWLPTVPPKAYRWVPETREIAATFEAVGLTPLMLQGAAAMYVDIAQTSAGRESPEQARSVGRNGTQVVSALDEGMPK
jgi:3-hydroxyisobutyrate dehydrogenase-like beta-hydroxyacid dehydrogenase